MLDFIRIKILLKNILPYIDTKKIGLIINSTYKNKKLRYFFK